MVKIAHYVSTEMRFCIKINSHMQWETKMYFLKHLSEIIIVQSWCHKHHNNTNMFPLPPWHSLFDTSGLSTCISFQLWNQGEGLGTRDWKLHCLYRWKSTLLMCRYGRGLRHANQIADLKFCNGFTKILPIF